MTATFKNHEEFINWGEKVVGESDGCWVWVEGRMSEKNDKFYWFARCVGAQYYGDDALPFGEEEWAETLPRLKAVYQYYFGEEMPNGLNATHPNHALVLDAFNAITCDAQWCEKCGDYRFWGTDGDVCAACEKVQVGLRSGVYIPDEESEETKGEKCECGAKFCRCDEGTDDDEDDNCCEMCGDKADREEWVDENGTGILYCEDCYNRMTERKEKKAKEQKEAFNRAQSWWGHRVSIDDCGVKVIYDPETEGWLTAEDSCLDCGCAWDRCECEDPDYSLPKKIKQEATDKQIEEAEAEAKTKIREEENWSWDDVCEFIDGIDCDEEPVE